MHFEICQTRPRRGFDDTDSPADDSTLGSVKAGTWMRWGEGVESYISHLGVYALKRKWWAVGGNPTWQSLNKEFLSLPKIAAITELHTTILISTERTWFDGVNRNRQISTKGSAVCKKLTIDFEQLEKHQIRYYLEVIQELRHKLFLRRNRSQCSLGYRQLRSKWQGPILNLTSRVVEWMSLSPDLRTALYINGHKTILSMQVYYLQA